ncbi:LanC-like protein [Bradyrhizobium sp.]|uniref:lanthionine synthetase C family protein n=1 Tax=Bradyrhizobium sp. TaxID=376 RepID=UPI001ECEFBF4|nr:LanC-like protein [Bradyrhizobium sp.]MBV9982233.1 LanC-like protein [Bradyrhizobium sp.]
MFDPARHVHLPSKPWNAGEARTAIAEIVSDTIAHFDQHSFWPAHPQDDGLADGNSSVYFGAAGVIWALDYLKRVGASERSIDVEPLLPGLLERTRTEMSAMGEYGLHGSLLFGDLGTALVAMRIAPSASLAEIVHRRAVGNAELAVRELMWGTPGSMLSCIAMAEITAEDRWRRLFSTQAARLLDELTETEHGPLWTQDLYGQRRQYLGPVHGYAGNMIPLMRGWEWLAESQRARVADAVPRTLAANAVHSEMGCTWRPAVDGRNLLCQHCHGAPGMVTTFADAPFASDELERLLIAGGELTWAAGPLTKGSNLCHGTGGNGYAFLKLYRRTRDPIWLERARTFAMAAISQCRSKRNEIGRGRYSLWTGDVGLAIYLWNCVTGQPAFPTVDVF